MKTSRSEMWRVTLWLGLAWLFLVAPSPLFAQQPTLRKTLQAMDPGARTDVIYAWSVWCVAFSPDGKLLASSGLTATGEGHIKLWDVESGKNVAVLYSARPGMRLSWAVRFYSIY